MIPHLGFLGIALALFVTLNGAEANFNGMKISSRNSPDDQLPSGSKELAKPDTMRVAEALMVTVELDFGPNVSGIIEALKLIERRYTPDDGKGRTFAILQARGERTANRKFHISMHVSTEKTGVGQLVFRKTGEMLWNCRIVRGEKAPPAVKNLGIFIDDGQGHSLVVDGSRNPTTILDAHVQGMERLIRDIWPNNEVREVTFTYSTCGCPVNVMAKRIGDRIVRTEKMPVIFPDDPAVDAVINRLMKW